MALQYLKGLKDAGVEEVIVAHVMDEKGMRLQPPDKVKEFKRIDEEKLEAVKQDLEKVDFNVKLRINIGKASVDIIKIAKEEDISLIVMGSHGKGYVEGILWGSVSRTVVEYSDRPVLLIKSEKCRVR